MGDDPTADPELQQELETQKKEEIEQQQKMEKQQMSLLRSRLSGGSTGNVWDSQTLG